ncbi:DUF1648 domain-containing protein [Riemerella columbina]|uniref:DUF1648 domain-containing protein n=1 Tax=Riemerella columbina TaxID=103810 RepID=UPI00266F4CE2|nr:DUF1648 domain-containing protein [Riemerella columbina]WKS95642.1 DUF1648 domain-containing protein [Riemerella columbina]
MMIILTILDILNIAILTYLVIASIKVYPRLPKKIPTHFGIDLEPDAWGSKAMIFLPPILAVVTYLLNHVLFKDPSSANYIVPITPENEAIQYCLAEMMHRFLLLTLFGLFYVIFKMMSVNHYQKYKK